MASKPYERFHPGEARGLLDPTWPGVTERDVQETWRRNLESFNERQREKKRERVREVYGTVPPPKRGLLDSEPYTSEWFEGMSDRAYVDSGLRPEHMVGPMAGVRLSSAVKGTPANIFEALSEIGFKKILREPKVWRGSNAGMLSFHRGGTGIKLEQGALAEHMGHPVNVAALGEKVPDNNVIIKSLIIQPLKRGTKAVRDVMEDVMAMGDKTKTTFYVQPSPIADRSKNQLVQMYGEELGLEMYAKEFEKLFRLYKKFGFQRPSNNSDIMVRFPHGKQGFKNTGNKWFDEFFQTKN